MCYSYFQWLISLIPNGDEYSILLYTLHSIDYYYDARIPIDGARGDDGLSLREMYLETFNDGGNSYDILTRRPCTVLEWLLGMAIRCERDIMFNENEGDRTGYWFWSMLDNMGISNLNNAIWNDHYTSQVMEIVDFVLNRMFDFDGAGGPFPLTNTAKWGVNCKEIDWWRALNLWISENFEDEIELD